MTKKQTKLQFQPQKGHRTPCHYFASSVASWKASDNLDDVLDYMKKDGYPFNLWKIPLPPEAEYKISNYSPQVEGCTFIGFWGIEEQSHD